MPAVVVDAGGTHLRCAVAGEDGTLGAYRRQPIPNFLSGGDPNTLWDAVVETIASYIHDVERVMETGNDVIFAVPGPVVDGSRLAGAPTVAGMRHEAVPDIAAVLAERTRRRVHLINDVSAAAWQLSTSVAADRFFVVTVSSGIGSKLFDRAHPQRVFDAEPFAGEIGHVVVDTDPGAPLCDCGGRGHLGAIASGRGTERLARRTALGGDRAYRNSLLHTRYRAKPDEITNEQHLVPAAQQGDAWALSVITQAAQPLARVLSAVVAACAIERIFVIGGFAQHLGAIYQNVLSSQLQRLVNTAPFPFPGRECVRVLESEMDVCLAGAAAYYNERCAVLP